MVTEGFRRIPTEEDLNPNYTSGPGEAHKDPLNDEHWIEIEGKETLEELLKKLNFVKNSLKKKAEIREEKNIFKKIGGIVSNISISKESGENHLENAKAEILLQIKRARTEQYRESRYTKEELAGVTNWYKFHSNELVERSVPMGSIYFPDGCRIEYENGEAVRAFDGEENEIPKKSFPRLPLLTNPESTIKPTEEDEETETVYTAPSAEKLF